jgi:exodeoxyribonuclease VII small subunit
MKLFERGQALVKKCGAALESAQLKIQKLAGDSLIPFEEESE